MGQQLRSLRWSASLALFAVGAVALAEEELPPRVAVQALLKVLTYDRNFEAHGTGDFLVAIAYAPGQSSIKEHVVPAALELAGSRIQGRALRFAALELSDEGSLRDSIEIAEVSAIMVLPGLSDEYLAMIAKVSRERHLYTLGLEQPSLVQKAIAVGVTSSEGRPQILLNLMVARQLNAEFDPALVKLAKIYDEEAVTPPVELTPARPIVYTEEALRARVEGVMSVRCLVATSGKLEDCRVLRSLQHMDHAVLESLAARRYQPATFQGQPVPVEKVFDIRLVAPSR